MFVQVMLVVLFGFPEIGGSDDFGDDRAAEAMRGGQLRDGGRNGDAPGASGESGAIRAACSA